MLVRLVIENKIQADERHDQLAGYARRHLAELPDEAVLVPVLIELGDNAAGYSSCPWTVCWGRAEVAVWLRVAGAPATRRQRAL